MLEQKVQRKFRQSINIHLPYSGGCIRKKLIQMQFFFPLNIIVRGHGIFMTDIL